MPASWLSRKCKAKALFVSLIKNYQIVAVRLTMEISINHLRNKQFFTLNTLFQFFINRTDFVFDKPLIIFRRSPSLFELPLSLEQRRFINERKDFIERNILDYTRTNKRGNRNRDFCAYIRTRRVTCVARATTDTARLGWLADTELCFFANQIFKIFLCTSLNSFACVTSLPVAIDANELVHGV